MTGRRSNGPASGRVATGDPSSPVPDEPGLWATYRPFFRGRRASLGLMAGSSFVSGAVESVLLVLVANIALTIGGKAGGGEGIAANLGPLDRLDMSVGTIMLVALALGLVRTVFQVLSAATSARLVARLSAEIRAGTFRDYAGAAWAEQSRRSEVDVQDLLIRHVNKATAAVQAVAKAVTTAFVVLALMISAVAVDPFSAVLLVVAGGALFVVIRPLTGWAKSLSRSQLEAGRTYQARSLEALGLSQEIRSFGVSEEVIDRLDAATAAEIRPTERAMVLRESVTAVVPAGHDPAPARRPLRRARVRRSAPRLARGDRGDPGAGPQPDRPHPGHVPRAGRGRALRPPAGEGAGDPARGGAALGRPEHRRAVDPPVRGRHLRLRRRAGRRLRPRLRGPAG